MTAPNDTITTRQAFPRAVAPACEPRLGAPVLDAVAARFRPAGLFAALFRADGSVAYHDPEAPQFFRRYVLPMLQEKAAAAALGEVATRFLSANAGAAPGASSGSEGAAFNALPGVAAAVYPHTERRQFVGVLLLAAKAGDFALGENVLRACGRLGVDATWLGQQAGDLPGYGEPAILSQGRLLAGTVRDHTRLAGMEVELNSLSGQLANTYEELSLIYQVSGGMKINRRAADFFRQACHDVLQVINVRGMGVALGGELAEANEPVVYGAASLPPDLVRRLHAELLADMQHRKAPLLINDLSGAGSKAPGPKGSAPSPAVSWLAAGGYARQLLAVPLQRQEQVLGCVFALDKQVGEFDSVDSKLLNSIANESAIYLENVMLFGDVHGLMMGLLHSLTSAVDAKDAYTCGHSERVALVSRHVAQQAGLDDRTVQSIYMAGLLHDVGKIGVPEAVLQKTGRLTAEEFEQMKKHPGIGARILQDVKQLREIIPGVLHHHERYDGKGYPANLAGEKIPLMGRIICLADCFDAMTSNRTYRRALPLEVALTEIRRCSGTQFDPVMTEVFLRTGPEGFRELLRDHQAKAKRLCDLQETLRAA